MDVPREQARQFRQAMRALFETRPEPDVFCDRVYFQLAPRYLPAELNARLSETEFWPEFLALYRGLTRPAREAESQRTSIVTVRMPRSLHLMLRRRAADTGVSMNRLAVELLTMGLGKEQQNHGSAAD